MQLSRQWIMFAILPLATGIGLVVYVVAGINLVAGAGIAALLGIAAAATVWQRVPFAAHRRIRRFAAAGFVAGLLATLAYDLCRYIFVTLLHISFWPFDIFTIFGRLLLGPTAPPIATTAFGVLFHYTNGTGFAIAYIFFFRRPGLRTGLLWAAFLELCMITIYPSWLGLKALDELLSVSIFGHTIYGLVLGSVSRYALARQLRE